MKNQIKKVLSLVLVVVMCLSTFALCVSAEEECAHANKIQTSTTEATCLGYGYTSYKCADCGADFVEDLVKPLGHDWSEETTTPATCENEAGTKKVCKRCKTEDVKPGASTGKECTWGEPEFKVIEGDLTKVETCTVCGNVKETVIDAGHSHDAEASNMEMVPETLKKPTCTEKGSVDYKCNHEDCGFVVTVEIKETHQLTEHAAKLHTCEEDGNYKYWTCDLCEAYFMMVKPEGEDEAVMTKVDAAKIVDKAAHDLVKGALKSAEDCTPGIEKKAVYTWICQADGCDYTEDKAEENFVHNFVTDVNKSYAATCVKYGFEFKYCTVCGVSESKTIAPLGFLVKDDADNKKDVYKTLAELKAGVADYIVKKNDAPCGGYATYVYKIYAQCGDANCICKQAVANADGVLELAVEYGEIKQHPYAEVNKAVAPTCTQPGNKALWECPVCKEAGEPASKYVDPERDGSVIDALGHDWSEDILYCSVEDKAILQCEVCDAVADAFLTEDELEELEFVKPEGTSHIELVKEYEAPSCTEDGKKITYCYACHQLTAEGDKIEVIPAIGHSIDFEKDEYFVQAGSCQAQIQWIYSCKNEGCTYNVAVSKGYDKTAAGHMAAMEAEGVTPTGTVLRNATCTVRSLTEYTCTECNVKFTVLGDAEDTGSHVLDKNHTEAPICAIGQNGKTGVYCLTCAAAGKYAWVSFEEVPFVHDKAGKVAARPTCLTKAEYDANPYGWEEFTYCEACNAYELDETIEKPEGFEMALESKAAMTIVNRKAAHNNEDENNGKKVSEKIESTCDAVGVDKFTYCVACGDDPAKIIAEAKKSDKYKWNGKVLQLPKKEHMKGKETAVEADCVNFGYTLTYCAFCSDALIVDFDYENGHSWIIPEDEEDILTENLNDSLGATYDCTKPGYKYYACENCNERNKFDEVAPHHVDADGNKIFDCTDAEEDFDCIHCGKVELESLHDYKSTVNDIKLPTCTEPGWKISICATCGHQEDLNGDEPGNILILAPVGHHSVWFVEPDEDEDIEGGWFYSVYEQVDEDANGDPIMAWVAYPAYDLEDALYSVELVEDKCVEPTHTADGKVVYLCAVCEEEVEIVVPQLKGVALDITADNAIVPGAPIVNGGKVQFTVAINANDVDAAGIKADFFYDATVLEFISAESAVAPIFDATIDGQTVATTSIIGTPVIKTLMGEKLGHITVVADASKTEGGTSVDVTLNGEDIKFVTLTFRVAAGAKDESMIYGLVSGLTNAKGEMAVDIDVNAVFTYYEFLEKKEAIEAKYEKELGARDEAEYDVFNAEMVIESIEAYLEEAEAELAEAEAALEAAEEAVEEAEEALESAKAALEDIPEGTDATAAQEHVAACELALAEAEAVLAQATQAVVAYEAVIEEIEAELVEAEKALAVAEALLEKAEEALEDYYEESEKLQKEAFDWLYDNFEDQYDFMMNMMDMMSGATVAEFEIAKLGDVNGDGSINIADVVAIRKMQFTNMDGTLADDEYYTVLETEEEDEEGNPVTVKVETNFLVTADFDMDGDVDLADYALINQYLVGNITYEQLVLTSQAAAQ